MTCMTQGRKFDEKVKNACSGIQKEGHMNIQSKEALEIKGL